MVNGQLWIFIQRKPCAVVGERVIDFHEVRAMLFRLRIGAVLLCYLGYSVY